MAVWMAKSAGERSFKYYFDDQWHKNRMKFLHFLIDAGIDVNVLNKYGMSLLCSFAEYRELEMVEFLHENGADLSVRNSDGTTPLHIATSQGHLNLIKYFISRGVSPNICDNEENTPLHYISKSLTIACKYDRDIYRDVVNFLVDSGADINLLNRRGDTPLLSVAKKDHIYLVKLFLRLGASIDIYYEKKWTFLHYVSGYGWENIVKFCIKRALIFDPDQTTLEGFSYMYLAARNSHRDIVELFMRLGAKVDWCDDSHTTLLHYSCKYGWFDFVQYLVNAGLNVNAMNDDGFLPLTLAAHAFHINIVEYLIACGANVEHCWNPESKKTLLHYACQMGWLNVVKFLIEQKVDLDASADSSTRPLHLAVRYRHTEIVKCMLEAGADWNSINEAIVTPFQECIRNNFMTESIHIFIEHGAHLHARDHAEMLILLKKGFLQNVYFCAKAYMNHLKYAYLPQLYNIPVAAATLPPMESMQILSRELTDSIVECVKLQIQTEGYYDLLQPRPIMLRSLCAKSFLDYYYLRLAFGLP